MDFQNLSFEYPKAAFLLILIIPLACLLFFLILHRKKILETYSTTSNLQRILQPRSFYMDVFKSIAWLCVWIFAGLALMGPKGNISYTNNQGASQLNSINKKPPHKVTILIDASNSMSINDARNGINRLDHAKQIVEELISKLDGQNISIQVFTSSLFPVVPPTLDYLYALLTLKGIQIGEGDVGAGTNLFGSLKTINETLAKEPLDKLNTIILLSDGGDSQIEIKPEGERKEVLATLLNTIPNINNKYNYFITIGIGSKNGGVVPNVLWKGKEVNSSLQTDVLENIAKKENGIYFEANQFTAWDLSQKIINLLEKRELQFGKETVTSERTVKLLNLNEIKYDLFYQIPLGIALVLMFIIFALPDTGFIDLFRKRSNED